MAPVSDGPAVADLEQANARGSLFDDPSGTFRVPRRPWRIDGEAGAAAATGPAPGRAHRHRRPASAEAAALTHGRRSSRCRASRCVDLTAWWAGPSASAMLAALGADVVHVESVTRADGMRYTSGVSADRDDWWEYSALFHTSNTNKRDLTLDLTRPEGRDARAAPDRAGRPRASRTTRRVSSSSSISVGTWCTRTNPRAVMVRMPAFGLDGPWRDRPGFAQTMEQVTGLAWLTGHVDDQPRIQRGPCDPERRDARGLRRARGARACATAPASARWSSRPMFEAALNISAELIVEWTKYGNALSREGSRSPWAAPQGVYATDHPGAVAGASRWRPTSSGRRWSTRSGGPDWATDPALRTHAGRRAASRPPRREAGRVGGRSRPRQGGRPARLGGGAGRAGGRRPAHVGAPAVRRPGLLRVPRTSGDRRPRATRRCRSASPASTTGSAARRRRSASTTTRSSPASASPTRRSPRSRPTTSSAPDPLGL